MVRSVLPESTTKIEHSKPETLVRQSGRFASSFNVRMITETKLRQLAESGTVSFNRCNVGDRLMETDETIFPCMGSSCFQVTGAWHTGEESRSFRSSEYTSANFAETMSGANCRARMIAFFPI